MIEYCKEEGLIYWSISPKPMNRRFFEWPITNGGLLTVSRYPIIDTQFIGFEHSASVDQSVWKGGLYTEILIDERNERKVHVFNTHLQAQYNPFDESSKMSEKRLKKCIKSTNVRISQICDLRKLIDHVINEKGIEDGNINNPLVL